MVTEYQLTPRTYSLQLTDLLHDAGVVVDIVAVIFQPSEGEFVPQLCRLNVKFVCAEHIVLNIKQPELMRLCVECGVVALVA